MTVSKLLSLKQMQAMQDLLLTGGDDLWETRLVAPRTVNWLIRQGYIEVVNGKPLPTRKGEAKWSLDCDRREAAYYRRHPDEMPSRDDLIEKYNRRHLNG
jgi:hypothetical protein